MPRRLLLKVRLWLKRKLRELPDDPRLEVERTYIVPWDALTPEQRKKAAEDYDAQHPTDPYDRQYGAEAFHDGFKSVSVPRRNRRNAARPRPSRQSVSDDDLAGIMFTLDAEGVPRHKQCAEAYHRLDPPITLRGFRKRWGKVADKKKGT